MSNDSTSPMTRGFNPAEANELEAAIRAHGIDPEAPESYPIWSTWQTKNYHAALALLGVQACASQGEDVRKPKHATLTELRERREALQQELKEIQLQQSADTRRWRECQQIRATSLDSNEVKAVQREMIVLRNNAELLQLSYNDVARRLNAADISYHQGMEAVRVARANLQRLSGQAIIEHEGVKLGLGDIRRLQKRNREILAKYGEPERGERVAP